MIPSRETVRPGYEPNAIRIRVIDGLVRVATQQRIGKDSIAESPLTVGIWPRQ